MKNALIALAICLAVAGCANEVYERNLQYMAPPTYAAEKVIVAKRLEEAQQALALAQTSGDQELIKKARRDYEAARSKARSVEFEERRRNRGY